MSSVEVLLTVGKLDASLALLTTSDHHVIEFPTVLLPDNVKAGSIVSLSVSQNLDEEKKQRELFREIQAKILEKYGTRRPNAPFLRIINVTQTNCVLGWDPLYLGSARLKSLTLFRQGVRSTVIPNPLKGTTTKISGLSVDTEYEFQLKLSTTSGQYWSEKVKVHTHKMTDMSGITVCLGPLDPLQTVTEEQITQSLSQIGARPLQHHVAIDTTHFVTNDIDNDDDPELLKAKSSNIPIVRPEWVRASETEKRIVGVRGFYLDADPGILKSYQFPPATAKSKTQPANEAETVAVNETAEEQIGAQSDAELEISTKNANITNENPHDQSSNVPEQNGDNADNQAIEPTETSVSEGENGPNIATQEDELPPSVEAVTEPIVESQTMVDTINDDQTTQAQIETESVPNAEETVETAIEAEAETESVVQEKANTEPIVQEEANTEPIAQEEVVTDPVVNGGSNKADQPEIQITVGDNVATLGEESKITSDAVDNTETEKKDTLPDDSKIMESIVPGSIQNSGLKTDVNDTAFETEQQIREPEEEIAKDNELEVVRSTTDLTNGDNNDETEAVEEEEEEEEDLEADVGDQADETELAEDDTEEPTTVDKTGSNTNTSKSKKKKNKKKNKKKK